MASSLSQACTFAIGHFHQVTSIRGRIVGRNLGPLGFRWLRQSFAVKDATRTLYEFRWAATIQDPKKVAEAGTDSHGHFDFGLIPNRHYHLLVSVKDSDRMGASFDVEVTDNVKPTKTIAIDASPIHPDCKGGNEFIETKA